ncbi:MAG TPA: alpha/beta hydrolase [Stellaceae bacterium]|nr:alpha/beta hydrolase [Stellaceae bacterium]
MAFTRHALELPQGSVAYHRGGDGPPLLYFHSAGGVRIGAAVETLAMSRTIYMPVVPGFDGTDRLIGVDSYPDLARLAGAFADKLIEGECDVAGHSFGGRLAIWFAAFHPRKVRLLVLECPSGFRPAGAGPLSTDPKIVARQMFAHPERIPPNEKSPEEAARNRAVANHYHKGVDMDRDLVARLGEIATVTLILHGTKDGMIPIESANFLKARIPRSHLVFVYDAAHAIEVDQPERFAALVGDFLERGQAFLVNPGAAGATA